MSSSRMSQATHWVTPAEASITYEAWLDPAVSLAIDRRSGRRIDRRLRFAFADGFLACRGESSWPRGVQEDDDFRWAWSAGARR